MAAADQLERRVNSIDQRLAKLEGLYESLHASITSILAFQQAHSERLTALSERLTAIDGRFDDLEKLIRESLNGQR